MALIVPEAIPGESRGVEPVRLVLASCSTLLATAIGQNSRSSWAAAGNDEWLLYDALRAAGVPFHVRAWDDTTTDWSSYDLVCVRTTWDYAESEARAASFRSWLQSIAAAGVTIANPGSVMCWNTHKRYLLDIAASMSAHPAPDDALEVRTIPTALISKGRVASAWDRAGTSRACSGESPGASEPVSSEVPVASPATSAPAAADLAALVRARGWSGLDLMIKPAVGGGSRACLRVPAGEVGSAGQAFLHECVCGGGSAGAFDVLVQPFLPGVAQGELSIVVIDGAVSHVVRKVPRSGDFRCQEEFGAQASVEAGGGVNPAICALAARVLGAAAEAFAETGGAAAEGGGGGSRGGLPSPQVLAARVDLLPLLSPEESAPSHDPPRASAYALLEVELVEPSLFFREAARAGVDAAGAMARALQKRLLLASAAKASGHVQHSGWQRSTQQARAPCAQPDSAGDSESAVGST
jgi:hypothetical protein